MSKCAPDYHPMKPFPQRGENLHNWLTVPVWGPPGGVYGVGEGRCDWQAGLWAARRSAYSYQPLRWPFPRACVRPLGSPQSETQPSMCYQLPHEPSRNQLLPMQALTSLHVWGPIAPLATTEQAPQDVTLSQRNISFPPAAATPSLSTGTPVSQRPAARGQSRGLTMPTAEFVDNCVEQS